MPDRRNDPLGRMLSDLADEYSGRTDRLSAAEVRHLGRRRRLRRIFGSVAALLALLLVGGGVIALVGTTDDRATPDIAQTPSAAATPTGTPSATRPMINEDDLPAAEDILWSDAVTFTRAETSTEDITCVDQRSDDVQSVGEVRGDYKATDSDLPRATVTLLQYGSADEAIEAAQEFDRQLDDCGDTEKKKFGEGTRQTDVYDIALGDTGMRYTEAMIPAQGGEEGGFRSLGVHRVGAVIALVGFYHQAPEHYVDFTPDQQDIGRPHPMLRTMPNVARGLGENLPNESSSSTSTEPPASSSSQPTGSEEPTGSKEPPPSTPSPPPEKEPSGPTSPAIARCTSGNVSVTGSRADGAGAAGSTTFDITATNTGQESCTVQGYPGVSLVDASGAQIGAAADRVSPAGETVTLEPGQSASATLRITRAENYDEQECDPTVGTGIRVILPDERDAALISTEVTGCRSDSMKLLQIKAFS